MNKIFLIGNLTKNPELSSTTNGKSVCKFTLAVQRRYANNGGVREADFFPIIIWGAQGENCNKYLKKGSKAAITGSVQIRNYEQDGTRRYITEVVAEEVQFLNSKNDSFDEEIEELPTPSTNSFNNMKPVEEELPF